MTDPEFDETISLPNASAAAKVPPEGAVGTPTDIVGKQLGDFRVLRRLGGGGMADVYLAEQVSLKRQVALKILKPELVNESDDTHLKRFKQEATAAANLSNPYIVQVYAIGEQDRLHYIAQEYVPGLTLREWLRKHGPPEPIVAIKLVRQVALALQAAAEAGIVHRDIKPENVLLTKKGDAKVADFGLAQLTQTGERVQLTQVGITMGTPLYMSPEQVAGRPIDHRSDIYSLGVTAYQLLAGAPPFRGETALSVAVQHLNVAAEPLQKVRPDLPLAICELVHKMMDKQVERRYQTAADVAEDLRVIGVALKSDPQSVARKGLASFSVAKSTPPNRWPLALDRFFEWSGRRHAAALLIAGLVIVLLATGIGWARRPVNPFLVEPVDAKVVRAENARAQYFAAAWAGTAEAYEAVRENFPDDTMWRPLATRRLALIRLSERDYGGAEELFREMAASSSDASSQLDGYVGLAVLAAIRNEPEEFKKRIAEVGNHLASNRMDEREINGDLRHLLNGARQRLGLDEQTRRNLDELLGEIGNEDPSITGEGGPTNGSIEADP